MRQCINICSRLKYVKSLRWVNKYEYRHCTKCAKYFKTNSLQCECCKDTLHIYYRPGIHVKINMKRKRNCVRSKIHYVIKHEEYVVRDLVFNIIQGARKANYKRLWAQRNKARVLAYQRQYYHKAKSINSLSSLN